MYDSTNVIVSDHFDIGCNCSCNQLALRHLTSQAAASYCTWTCDKNADSLIAIPVPSLRSTCQVDAMNLL